MDTPRRRCPPLLALALVLAPGLVAKDGPHTPVPRTAIEAPKHVWKALRDPAFPGTVKPSDEARLRRWNYWATRHMAASRWIEEHPAEARWIYEHQKLAAWAKTFPDKARLVDDHEEIYQFLRRDARARRKQAGQPGLEKIFARGKAEYWGVPRMPLPTTPPPKPEDIRASLRAEGLQGEALEEAFQKALGEIEKRLKERRERGRPPMAPRSRTPAKGS